MEITPKNRRLLLEPVEEKKTDGAFYSGLPEELGFVYQVISISSDVTADINIGERVVVPPNMIERYTLGKQEIFLAQENYVVCSFRDRR